MLPTTHKTDRWSFAMLATLSVFTASILLMIGLGWLGLLDAGASSPEARAPDQSADAAHVSTSTNTLGAKLAAEAGDAPYHNTSEALGLQRALLQAGLQELRRHPDYTATLQRQVRLQGSLQDEETIHLKLRNDPFSVHFLWPETGREVAYVADRNNGKLLVRPTGLARLFGTVKLERDDDRVTRSSRFAVDESGLLLLAERLLRERRADLQNPRGVVSRRLDDANVDGRPCFRFSTEYPEQRWDPPYSRLITYIDHQTLLPIRIDHYGGPDKKTLLGRYRYQDIQFHDGFNDADFQIGRR